MSLARFHSTYIANTHKAKLTKVLNSDFGVPTLDLILSELGGQTFNNGLYRVFNSDQVIAARHALEIVFPEYSGRIIPFAFDWLGRHFAADLKRIENNQPQILMIEVGAGEAMEIPSSLLDFHNIELVDFPNDTLAYEFWTEWRNFNSAEIKFTECVGYKVPLFLGGADIVSNLELIDMNVYVEICGQLRAKSRELISGQSISDIRFVE